MNREEIIRMAREAGFEADEPANDVWITDGYWADYLERFAALVTAAERDACAKVANQNYLNGYCVGRTDLLAEQAKAETVEPVAYIHETGFLVRNPAATLTAGMKLYSAPPKRKPLTEEEIKAALISVDSETKRLPPGFRDFARAIERAHGIGGKE